MQDLGTLSGGTSSLGQGINGKGQVTGFGATAEFNTHAFVWTKSGGMQELGTRSGGTNSLGQGINEHGQVTGYSDTADGNTHAFVWTP
jgi:probable HAF family extracellular repeat protein